MHVMKKHNDGLCGTCKVPETIEHYLMSCRESEIYEELKAFCDRKDSPFDIKTILNNRDAIGPVYGNVNREI